MENNNINNQKDMNNIGQNIQPNFQQSPTSIPEDSVRAPIFPEAPVASVPQTAPVTPPAPANSRRKTTLAVACRILGPVLLVLGSLYIFGGAHLEEWRENPLLTPFPSVSRYLVLPIEPVWSRLDDFLSININGRFGIELWLIAFIMVSLSRPEKSRKYGLKSAYTVAKLISITFLIWHCLIGLMEDLNPFAGVFQFIVTFLACLLIGRAVNYAVRKISAAKAGAGQKG